MPVPDRAHLKFLSKNPKLMADWLGQWDFERFVTLTFNQPGEGVNHTAARTTAYMRNKLKHMDARMNRKLVGRDYYNRPYGRMFHFFAPEKITTNPHWHGVVSFLNAPDELRRRHAKIFDENLEPIWLKLVPQGSVDVKIADDLPGGINYVAKALCVPLNWDNCILPDEFQAT